LERSKAWSGLKTSGKKIALSSFLQVAPPFKPSFLVIVKASRVRRHSHFRFWDAAITLIGAASIPTTASSLTSNTSGDRLCAKISKATDAHRHEPKHDGSLRLQRDVL
jgi:hypothetical protein